MSVRIDREGFRTHFQPGSVADIESRARGPLAADERAALERADLDGDGTVGNTRAEVDAAWRAADRFDGDGARDSVEFGRGRGFGVAAALAPEADPLRDLTATQESMRAGSLAQEAEAQRARATSAAEGASATAPRTTAGGRLVGNVRLDNTQFSPVDVARVRYDRPMTREQVLRDVFGRDTNLPAGCDAVPNRHSRDVESAREWHVTMPAQGYTPLTDESAQVLHQPGRRDPAGRVPDEVYRQLNRGEIPEGSRQVRPGVYRYERTPGTVIELEPARRRWESVTMAETNQGAIRRRGICAVGNPDPELYARHAASVNRQYNSLVRYHLDRGASPTEAARLSREQLHREGRIMMGAWGIALAAGQGPGAARGLPNAGDVARGAGGAYDIVVNPHATELMP